MQGQTIATQTTKTTAQKATQTTSTGMSPGTMILIQAGLELTKFLGGLIEFGYKQSGEVQAKLVSFIDQFRRDTNFRNVMKNVIYYDYKQAPEFFNSTINDNLEKLNLFDPVAWGDYLVRSRPKCIPPTSKCNKEHRDYIKRVEDYVNYITEKASAYGKVLNFYPMEKFLSLPSTEQFKLIKKYEKGLEIETSPSLAGFKFDMNFMLMFLLLIILLTKR